MEDAGNIRKLRAALLKADAVVIGAGAGLSASAGMTYDGERFRAHFADFEDKYGFHDMYAGGFYPYETKEELWAFWSRNIYINRYGQPESRVYKDLLELIRNMEYFVITTNVDHCFQLAGINKARLFYTQGDYGLFQCSKPCSQVTYDNEAAVRRMYNEQKDMKIPSELISKCPVCGAMMTMNLRIDGRFVQDEGWYRAADRYEAFLNKHNGRSVLLLELGVGYNSPGVIKFPFLGMTASNPNAVYARVNLSDTGIPPAIAGRSILIKADIGTVLRELLS
jgi:NAD-dependent SIR2 family protein deacetylase